MSTSWRERYCPPNAEHNHNKHAKQKVVLLIISTSFAQLNGFCLIETICIFNFKSETTKKKKKNNQQQLSFIFNLVFCKQMFCWQLLLLFIQIESLPKMSGKYFSNYIPACEVSHVIIFIDLKKKKKWNKSEIFIFFLKFLSKDNKLPFCLIMDLSSVRKENINKAWNKMAWSPSNPLRWPAKFWHRSMNVQRSLTKKKEKKKCLTIDLNERIF